MNSMSNARVAASLGSTVRRVRATRDVSLREMARLLGISPATLSAIETDKVGLSVARLHQIAALLDTSAVDLLEGAHPASPVAPAGPAPTATVGTGDWREFAPLPIDSVLASAVRAIVATGYHGTSMRSIARQANMSVPGVYHHYASKQDLLTRILDITMTDLIWRVQKAAEEAEDDPIARIRLVVQALALFHTRRNDLAFIGASEMRSLHPDNYRRIGAMRDHVQHVLDRAVDEAIDQGYLQVEHARDAGKAIATMCTGLTQWYHPDGPTTPEKMAEEYAEFALRLLGHRVGPRRTRSSSSARR
jgi:AcrR family transcriptional regulator/DNA-binding Xre family transcriptional regulator